MSELIAANLIDIGVPVAFVLLFIALLIYTQLVAPRRRIKRLREAILALGWAEIVPSDVPHWGSFEELAVGQLMGRQYEVEYEEKLGLSREKIRSSEQHSATLYSAFQKVSSRHPRLAACAMRTVKSKETRRWWLLPASTSRKRTWGYEFWLGEVRSLPVKKRVTVYSFMADIAGAALTKLAEDRGVEDQAIPEIASAMKDELAKKLQPLFDRQRKTLQKIRAEIHVSGEAWILAAPLQPSVTRLRTIESLADDLSDALGRLKI